VPVVKAPLLALSIAVAASLTAGPALAQTPTPAPAPAPGKATYGLRGGLVTKKMRYYAPAQQVVLRGRLKSALPGEVVTLYAIRGSKASKTVRRKVKAGGRFEFRFKVGNAGRLRLLVKHAASPHQVAFRTRSTTITWW